MAIYSTEKKTAKWNYTSEKDPADMEYKFVIRCPRCSKIVLKYKDGLKLFPVEVTHCGESDTFYIAKELK